MTAGRYAGRRLLPALLGLLARLRQQVERALDAGDHAGCDARVARRCVQFVVTQQPAIDDLSSGMPTLTHSVSEPRQNRSTRSRAERLAPIASAVDRRPMPDRYSDQFGRASAPRWPQHSHHSRGPIDGGRLDQAGALRVLATSGHLPQSVGPCTALSNQPRRRNGERDGGRVAAQHHEQHQPPDRDLDVDAGDRRQVHDWPAGGLDTAPLGDQAGALTLQVGQDRRLRLPTSGQLDAPELERTAAIVTLARLRGNRAGGLSIACQAVCRPGSSTSVSPASAGRPQVPADSRRAHAPSRS